MQLVRSPFQAPAQPWKERCEMWAGLTSAWTMWWYVQQAVWLYCVALALHGAWMWGKNWEAAQHSAHTAVIGAMKTFGFALVDLCAFWAMQASRRAYASEHLQACEPAEGLAMKCCILGVFHALAQAVYWPLFIYHIFHTPDCLVRLVATTTSGAGLVFCCPGLCCAFWPVLLGLSDAERRLDDFAKQVEGGAPMREVLTTYGRLEKHISTTAKELYSTVMWLLLACLLYALLQCLSVWIWIDKVDKAPYSCHVTYLLAVLYSISFGLGYSLFGGVEQRQSDILSALASRVAASTEDSQMAVAAYLYVGQRPITWKVPLSPKWPMAPTLERLQGALLVASSAGTTGFQLIQRVHEELKDDPGWQRSVYCWLVGALKKRTKTITLDGCSAEKSGCRWLPLQQLGRKLHLQGAAPGLMRPPMVAFVPGGQWLQERSQILLPVLALLVIWKAKRRG